MRLLRTALCRELGIEYPVFSVGFGSGARAELVAAVSNAGGFGVLGASGMPPEAVRAEVERTRTLTDRPFGINVIIADDPSADLEEDRAFFQAQLRAAADEGRPRSSSSGETLRLSSTTRTPAVCRC